MSDGIYERRGPREAELKRLQRLIDERRSKAYAKKKDRKDHLTKIPADVHMLMSALPEM